MKKLLLITAVTLVTTAAPALGATAPQYWGGEMGKNLPGATMTFKVFDGRVTDLQAEVRIRCHAAGGGPAPNSRLIDLHGPMAIEAGVFEDTKNVFDGGKSKVEGTFITTASAVGFYRARFRLDDMRHDYVRVCHTGKQDWTATPLSKRDWQELRN